MSLKQDALRAISSLPETVDIEDMMYRLYVLKKVEQGETAIEAGETTSLTDLKKEITSW